MEYDVIIIGAGPGGIFSAYELMKKSPETRVAVFEEGNTLEKRKCPIDGKKMCIRDRFKASDAFTVKGPGRGCYCNKCRRYCKQQNSW